MGDSELDSGSGVFYNWRNSPVVEDLPERFA
jgi:hypothetical protein